MESEINNDVLARLMYDAYYKEAGRNKALNNALLPLWHQLGVDRQRCWIAAARAARAAKDII